MEYALIYTLGNALEQIIAKHLLTSMHPAVMVLIFYISSALFSTLYACQQRQLSGTAIRNNVKQQKWLSIYCVSESIANCLWFASIWFIGLSGTVIFLTLTKIFKMYYGAKVFGEQITPVQVMLSLGVILAALIYAGAGDISNVAGSTISALSAAGYAISAIAQKHIAGKVPYAQAMFLRNAFNFLLVVLLVAGVLLFMPQYLTLKDIIDVEPWQVGATTALAVYGGIFLRIMYLKAYETIDLSVMIVIKELIVPILFIFSIVVLEEPITEIQTACALYIMIAAFYFIYLERLKIRKAST